MITDLYWIPGTSPGRLAIAPRPRGGDWLEDEMKSWRSAGLDSVVSLLTPDEAQDLDLQEEALYCRRAGLEFISYPITDRSVPLSDSGAIELIDQLDNYLASGKGIVVHCRQGIGRSGLIAAGLLIHRGVSFPEAIERVSSARQIPIPETPGQHAWIERFASTAQTEKQPARK